MRVLVTGAAGFIGSHICLELLGQGLSVLGVDNINGYYSEALKQARLARLSSYPTFSFSRIDISDRAAMEELFQTGASDADCVVHMAAQAGVRYSLDNPHAYADSNLVGFLNVLEGCRQASIDRLIYGSSSSVYGETTIAPFSETARADHPVSFYAATKRSNELMAYSYSHLFGIETVGLRFFTVYGPWGRPDMAYFSFAKSIVEDRPIELFNYGNSRRDYTYIDDVVEVVQRLIHSASPDLWKGTAVHAKVFNVGCHEPVEMKRFVSILETQLGKQAMVELRPAQPGDVTSTFADVTQLGSAIDFTPSTDIEVGLAKFCEWFEELGMSF